MMSVQIKKCVRREMVKFVAFSPLEVIAMFILLVPNVSFPNRLIRRRRRREHFVSIQGPAHFVIT